MIEHATEPRTFGTSEESRARPIGEAGAVLRASLKEKLSLGTYEHIVPLRPGIKLRFNLDLRADDLGRWQKASIDESQLSGLSIVDTAARVLANQNCAILVGAGDAWEEVSFGGKPATVRSPEFQSEIGVAGSSLEAVRELFGNDAHVIACSGEVVSRSGFGDKGGDIPPSQAR